MSPTTSDDIRAAYLRFFEERGHLVMPSASLIPAGDPTLLLTSAGMAPFKPYYAGDETPPNPRLASVQKCFRTTDIDEVGDFTHHTMFEMLGNFSIGDYFKREAISWAWEFTTGVLLLPPERIWVTVHDTDDEARAIWRDEVGVPNERIVTLGDKDNFWGPAGDEGACGPSSELYYDFGEEHGPGTKPGDDTSRFLEYWNLVFPQFYQAADGTRTDLPAPGIDTGMGLERMTAIMQGVSSAYETDLLTPIRQRVEQLAGKTYRQDPDDDFAIHVVTEHARSAAFLIADGVVPANEGRGYVLRRVIRRGIRFARKLGIEAGFLPDVAATVIERFGALYPELREHERFVLKTLESEEERFYEAYDRGAEILGGMIDYRKAHGGAIPETLVSATPDRENVSAFLEQHGFVGPSADSSGERLGQERAVELLVELVTEDQRELITSWPITVSGHEAFFLYDTYGFPLELTQEIAREQGLDVDTAGFERAMEEQRERGRAAARFGGGREEIRVYEVLDVRETAFLGYDRIETDTVIAAILKDGEPVQRADAGEGVEIVLRETPFYAEGGGQVGDTGLIAASGGSARVSDTQKPFGEFIVHAAQVAEGSVAVGDAVHASVDGERRLDVARNHTATHLLHAVLRDVLGSHVRQAGSLVAPDRLRFDFTHVSAVSRDELGEIERRINESVRGDLSLVKDERSYREATANGALAFFGERYGDRVRTVQIGEVEPVSFEVCGGTHLERTGQIGTFRVVGESSVGTGVRRIEAVTGRGGEEWVSQRLRQLDEAAALLRSAPAELPQRIEGLLAQAEEARRSLRAGQREASRQEAETLRDEARDVGGVQVLAVRSDAPDAQTLREMGDRLRDKLGSGVVVLGSVFNGRPGLLAMVTPDLVERGLDAGAIVNEAARVMGGGGGGQPRLAQAGGKDASKLDDALAAVADIVTRQTG
ncbi:MAG: alanine--tRNA ligase [Chloroflexi bacterium]|nr:alanine--tRNA ligase [Chloroflexota bacterium]